jgi:hypothetical protein
VILGIRTREEFDVIKNNMLEANVELLILHGGLQLCLCLCTSFFKCCIHRLCIANLASTSYFGSNSSYYDGYI